MFIPLQPCLSPIPWLVLYSLSQAGESRYPKILGTLILLQYDHQATVFHYLLIDVLEAVQPDET